MPTQVRQVEYRPKFEVQFIQPVGAGAGKLLTSNAEGLASWKTEEEALVGVVFKTGVQTITGKKTIEELVVGKKLEVQGALFYSETANELEVPEGTNHTLTPGQKKTYYRALIGGEGKAPASFGGLGGGVTGQIIIVQNVGGEPIVIKNEDPEATEGTRFKILGGVNLQLMPGDAAQFILNSTSVWELIQSSSLARRLKVTESLEVGTTLTAEGAVTVAKTLKVKEGLTAEGTFVAEKTAKIKGVLTAEAGAVFEKTARVKETFTAEGELVAEAAATVGTTLKVGKKLTVSTEGIEVVKGLTLLKEGLTVEGTITLPEESVTGKVIKKESIPKNRLVTTVQEELFKIAEPTAFAAYTSAKEETEEKGTFVTLIIKTKAEAAKAVVKLVNSGKEGVYEWDALAAGAQKLQLTFVVKKAGKWTATLSGAAESATISRVTLEP